MQNVQMIDQCLKVSGSVDFDTAAMVYQQGLIALKNTTQWPVLVDLSEVDQGNTLLLAIVLQWLKQCPDVNSLKLSAIPAKMQGILEASHLQTLLAA